VRALANGFGQTIIAVPAGMIDLMKASVDGYAMAADMLAGGTGDVALRSKLVQGLRDGSITWGTVLRDGVDASPVGFLINAAGGDYQAAGGSLAGTGVGLAAGPVTSRLLAELNGLPILGANVGEGARAVVRWAAPLAGEMLDDYLARAGLVLNVVERTPGGAGPAYKSTSPIDYDHVLGADYNAAGKPTGGHSLLNGDVKIVAGTESIADAYGVYKATIQVPDPTNPGQWLTKTSNDLVNTMFPKEWSVARIKVEVDAAWSNPQKTVVGNSWFSFTPSGVRVQGYLSPRTTVFPVYQGRP
jgi:hypothetical protein